MGAPSEHLSAADWDALQATLAGDGNAFTPLLERERERLRRMIAVRLDARVQARISPSDVLQEAHLEALQRLAEYVAKPTLPFFVWLRLITAQRLAQLHRKHLGAQARTAARETPLFPAFPEASSIAIAQQLVGRLADPADEAMRAELKQKLQDAMNTLDAVDREVLALRHFEHLSAAEVAAELGIQLEAAKKRHTRALRRLRVALQAIPGGLELFSHD